MDSTQSGLGFRKVYLPRRLRAPSRLNPAQNVVEIDGFLPMSRNSFGVVLDDRNAVGSPCQMSLLQPAPGSQGGLSRPGHFFATGAPASHGARRDTQQLRGLGLAHA